MKKILFLAAACFLVLQAASFADITVSGFTTGKIKITDPTTGKVTFVKAGEAMPAIADGSTIQVLSGTADISATGTSTVNVFTGSGTAQISTGTSATFSVDTTGSTNITSNTGSVSVTSSTGGSPTTIAQGSSMVVTASLNMGAGGGGGGVGGPVGGNPPVGGGGSGGVGVGGGSGGLGAEGYQAPGFNNLGQINTNIKTEESAKDISPVK